MSIASYPHMTDDGRKKMHKEMHKLANPEHLQVEMDFEEFISRMTNGNGRS